ncbi:MAG: Glycosyl transferase family 2 [Candidatus Gottesmanbacteria bacterium GW2011_GWB1_43_11]|uniref:Glycosyl transferase family 2 n=1 Tax=Candidatus Gottesmanbacteria bacterium GW2011_GWB1_43_11 TaxID=1618446 RepID=A0A0G1CH80_9BACT|nr:MAG: Glycosyl transferase family 2 [Candidatus Gottesmanbacteria bacterium GW2011_GWB1_43_11]
MTPHQRREMLSLIDTGAKAEAVARAYGISRKTLYKWKKRFEDSGQVNTLNTLKDRPRGGAHPLKPGKSYYHQARETDVLQVLDFIKSHPELSIAQIELALQGDPTIHIGYHGIYNILKNRHLGTVEDRIVYAQTQPEIEKSQVVAYEAPREFAPQVEITPQHLPAPPISDESSSWLGRFLRLASILSLIFTSTLFISFQLLTIFIGSKSVFEFVGVLFSMTALIFGLFFFGYSLKYYLTIALVLLFSRKNALNNDRTVETAQNQNNDIDISNYLSLLPNQKGASYKGLLADTSNITLTRHPFVSIHLPLYNEKRVVNRLLEAVTSLDYPNYEVIVCDDSTDETNEWRNHPRLKIIHRQSRAGFKGGALKEALNLMDPATEFVLVFDADFLPYPDTITQFLKYFQVTTGTLEFGKGSRVQGPGSSEDNDNEDNQSVSHQAITRPYTLDAKPSPIAAIQGYQWHVLNKSENWVTRGVRSEYAGSYVIERSGNEIYGGLKQIAGSVFMIRADLLRLPQYQWGTSITEDFELTLKLYRDGYKVVYTPYIQAPSECVSTLKRLIRQRMRWAEGHSHNIRKHFVEMLFGSSHLTSTEKLEFLYLAPYYLQSCFFVLGTLFWFVSEMVFKVRLPFWTQVWGWSLVLTNLLSLPLMNTVGMFLEEAEEKDYAGIPAFLLLSYILAPFQAYAAIKGFLEVEEGPWFRTPKTGKITDTFKRGRFYLWVSRILDRPKPAHTQAKVGLRLPELVRPPKLAQAGNAVLAILLTLTIILTSLAGFIPQTPTARASETHLKTLASVINNQQSQTKTREKIENPLISQFPISPGRTLEYIFHPEPRFRVKLDQYEVEATIIASPDLGEPKRVEAYKQNNKYVYPEIFPGVDLKYSDNKLFIQEEFILKEPTKLTQFAEKVKLTNLTISQAEGRVHLVPSEGGSPVFTFEKPYLYEEKHPEVKNEGIRYEIEKGAFDYTVKKVLTEEGKIWLADPNRSYPVVVDPTLYQSSPVATGIAQNEVRTGSAQRKIVYSTNSSAWYVFTSNDAKISYTKCSASSNCDEDSDWGTAVTVSTDTGRQHGVNLWYQQAGTDAGKIFAAWMDDSTVTEATDDSLAFRTIDTANSDNLGTQCNSPDAGDLTFSSYVAYIAAGNNGDVLVGYSRLNGAETPSDIFEVPTGGCSFTSIESGSGLPVDGAHFIPVAFEVATNRIQIIYNDNGGNNDLRQSQFDISSSTWNYADNDVDGTVNVNDIAPALTDGTDVWVMAYFSTFTDIYRCAPCTGDTAPSWIATDAIPWTGQTNIDTANLLYISDSPANTLVAVSMKDTAGSLQAYFKTTDADTISWSDEYSFNFTVGDNDAISGTFKVANDTQAAIVAREDTAYTFSTLPENNLVLLLLLPFIPRNFLRGKRRKKY